MPDKELAIVIRAKDRATKIVKGLKGGLKGLKDMAARMKKTLLITMAAAAAGFIALGLAIRKVTRASGIQEDAEKKLQQAMEATGNYTRDSYRDLLKYASALQEVTRFGDENTISMMSNLQTYGMEKDALKKSTKATLDLAAAKKMDLFAASELIGKAFVGETGTLSRYGIIIDASIPKTEKFAAVLKLINERFGGAAQAEAKTYTGRLIQMGNTWGDIKEVVGDAITKNKTVLDILGRVGNALKRAKKYLEDHREELKKYVTKVVEVAEKISKVVFPIIKSTARVFKNATKAIIDFFDKLVGGAIEVRIMKTKDAIESINTSINTMIEYSKRAKEVPWGTDWEKELNKFYQERAKLQETLNNLLEEQKKLKKEIVETEEKEVPAGKDSPLVSKTNKEYDFIQARVNVATTQMKHYWDDYFEDVLGMSVDWDMKMKKPISGHRMFVREALEEAKKYWNDYFLRAFGKTAYELDKTKDETKNAFNYMEEMSREAARSMQRSFSDFFFKGMKREFDSFEDALKSFGDSMLRIWSDYMAKMAAQALFGTAFLGGTGGGMGGILGSVLGWLGFEKGGIAPGGFKAFQSGSIVREPTVGLVGEGRRDEAIIPLEGGRVPVKFLGEGKGGVTVFQLFNINAIDGPSVERMVQNNKQVFWEVTAQGFSRNSALRQIMKRDG